MQHDIVRKQPESPKEPRTPLAKKPPSSVMKEVAITLILAVIAIGAIWTSSASVLSSQLFGHSNSVSDSQALEALKTRDVLDYNASGNDPDSTVSYSYKGAKLPDTLAENEVVARRTESSYTISVASAKDAQGNPVYSYQSVFYPQPIYAKLADGWYYREYATVPKKVFDAARKVTPLSLLFSIPKAYATSYTTGAGDGYASTNTSGDDSGTGSDYATSHAASTGTSFDYTTPILFVESYYNWYSLGGKLGNSGDGQIFRSFTPFNTSTIPAGATITAASVTLYATSTVTDAGGSDDFVTIIATTTQSSASTIATSDYSKCGAVSNPQEANDTGQRKSYASMSIGNAYTWTLNATGIASIKKSGQTSTCGGGTGVTCFGVRDGYDVLNVTPPNPGVSNGVGDSIAFSSSEAGASQQPSLSVSFSGTFAPWQFWDF